MGNCLKYLIVILAFCASAKTLQVNAATISASSCLQADVKAAIDSARSGDTVLVPAGTATWSATLIINKGITLRGAGVGRTIISNGSPVSGEDYIIRYQPILPELNENFRLIGFTFDGKNSGGGITIVNLSQAYMIDQVQIDHNLIMNCRENGHNTAMPAIRMYGNVYGLINNNQLAKNNTVFRILGYDNYSWNFPLEIGTSKYVYIESNTITENSLIISSGWGGRWVFRYNDVDLTGIGYNILDVHGNLPNSDCNPSSIRGVVGTEIYENTFTNLGRTARLIDVRGGTNLIFNNTVTGTTSGCNNTIVLREEDDNSSAEMGSSCYPLKTNHPGFDPIINTYIWNNKLNATPQCFVEDEVVMLIEKTDYWTDTLPWGRGGTDYFTKGLANARIGNCFDGDVYWETDTRRLYRCVGSNNWSFIYIPYDYPHPLKIVVQPPKNVKIVH